MTVYKSKRLPKKKGGSKMNNPEKTATQSTQNAFYNDNINELCICDRVLKQCAYEYLVMGKLNLT